MSLYQQPDIRGHRIKLLGRLGAAVAAGGAFAALSWNSAPPPDETTDGSAVQKDPPTAERQSVVTEDDALSQLVAKGEAIHGYSPWEPSQALTRLQAAPVDDLRSNFPTGGLSDVSPLTDQTETITTMRNAVPHSRSPP